MTLAEIKESRPLIVTNRTLSVLKQFAKINEHIHLSNGAILTRAVENTVFAKSNFEIVTDVELGIIDLPQFVKSCHNGSEVTRDGDEIVITNSSTEVRLPNTPHSSLRVPSNELQLPIGGQISLPFYVNKATITAIKRLGKKPYTNIHFICDGESITIKAQGRTNNSIDNHEGPTTPQSLVIATAELPSSTNKCFELTIPIENFRAIAANEQKIDFYIGKDNTGALSMVSTDASFIIAINQCSVSTINATI